MPEPLSAGSRLQWLSLRPHSPCADPAGHVIDLVNDQLPDISISEEDKKKNLALLEEAKSVSERFLTRRGRKSRSSPGDSPSGRAGASGCPGPLQGGAGGKEGKDQAPAVVGALLLRRYLGGNFWVEGKRFLSPAATPM